MANRDKLIHKRATIKRQLTRVSNYLSQLSVENIFIEYFAQINCRKENLATLISEYEGIQFEIETLGNDESLNIEENEREEFEEHYFNALSLAQRSLSSS